MKKEICLAIPTRKRVNSIERFIDKNYHNLEKSCDILFGVDADDKKSIDFLKEMKKKFDIYFVVSKSGKGVGNIRNVMTSWCHKNGYKYMMTTSDNTNLIDCDVKKFAKCLNKKIRWVGAWNRFYDFFGNMYGDTYINFTQDIIDAGNYDKEVLVGEDMDIFLSFVKKFGNNFYKVSKSVYFDRLRHEKGGTYEMKNVKTHKKIIKYMNKKYAEYIPEGKEYFTLRKSLQKNSMPIISIRKKMLIKAILEKKK